MHYASIVFYCLVGILISPSLSVFLPSSTRPLILSLILFTLLVAVVLEIRSSGHRVGSRILALSLTLVLLSVVSITNAHVGFNFRYFYLLGKCIVFFVAAYEIGRHGLDLGKINVLLYVATIIACLSVIILFMSGGVSAGERYNFDQDSFSAVGLAINYSAVFLLMLFAAIRGVGLGAFWAFLASIASACIVVFTASRGAIIAAGVSALLLSFVNFRRVSGAQVIVIFLGSIFVYFGSPLKNQLQYVFKRFTYSEGQMGGFSSGRDEILANYYHSWMDTARSVLFGIADYDVGNYPHNIVIEILIRFGALGACLSLIFLLVFVLDFYRNRCEMMSSSLGQLLCLLFLYSLVLAMFNSSLEQNFILFFAVGGFAGLFDFNSSDCAAGVQCSDD